MPSDRQHSDGSPGEDRLLDSWKEISVYLGRAVRTVQTWEKDEGLPVHRHQHVRGSTVYAYTSEIDAWLAARDGEAMSEDPPSRTPWVVASLAILVAALAGLIFWQGPARAPEAVANSSPDTTEPIWLLIARFENRTGEEILDGTLETALARQVANDPALVAAPPERVADTLRLMNRAPDHLLPRELALEVALRDGGIRAVLVGTAERLQNKYWVSVEVVETSSGLTIGSLTEESEDLEGLLPALSRLSNGVRETLGGSTPLAGNAVLPPVSTPSLEALSLYSRADAMMREANLGGPIREDAAEVLLRQAIEKDPDFASAHLLLGWTLVRQNEPFEIFIEPVNRAMELVDVVSEREALFIRGSHAYLTDDFEEAAAHHLALVEAYPDHFWGQNNLSGLLRLAGRREDALAALRLHARTRPNNFRIQYLLALNTTEKVGLEEAIPAIRHALALATPDRLTDPADLQGYAWLEGAPIWEAWLSDDLEPLAAEVERLELEISETPAGPWRQTLIWRIGRLEAALGRLERSAFWQNLNKSDAMRRRGQLAITYLRGDLGALRSQLDALVAKLGPGEFLQAFVPELLAELGSPDLAETLLKEHPTNGPSSLTRGHIALARGQLDEAVREFEDGLARIYGRNSRYFRAVQGLAEAHRLNGDVGKARVLLEEASGQRSNTISSFSADQWLQHQVRLADFYREHGLDDLAWNVESEVLALLALADADHPLRTRLLPRSDSRL